MNAAMTKIKILVVEDEILVAKDIQSMLRGLGYEVLNILSTG
jgi:CheY-like chemotaxis protein